MLRTTYASARENLAELCERAIKDREVIVISRHDGEDVALLAASELSSLMETVYLLRSPKNAYRLSSTIKRARAGKGKPRTIAELKVELGL